MLADCDVFIVRVGNKKKMEVCVDRDKCDRGIAARLKRKVYHMAMRPAMMFGLETVALTNSRRRWKWSR